MKLPKAAGGGIVTMTGGLVMAGFSVGFGDLPGLVVGKGGWGATFGT
jgi:hypothetical protein